MLPILIPKTSSTTTITAHSAAVLLFKTLTTTSTAHGTKLPASDRPTANTDDYFAAIQHLSTIIRRDIFMKRTLNKLRLTVDSELIYRVLCSCSASGTVSFWFFTVPAPSGGARKKFQLKFLSEGSIYNFEGGQIKIFLKTIGNFFFSKLEGDSCPS